MRKSKILRIGAFAKQFDVSIDTVRFYIANGLLIPERIHNQYSFNKKTCSDMEEILKLKNMRFTINEMRFLTSLRRLRNFVHNNDLEIYKGFINQKKQRLLDEMKTLENSISIIDKELSNISSNDYSENSIGIPLEFLNYLECPDCGSNLNLKEASIQNNSIFDGELLCDCGYKAHISDGILITDSSIEGEAGFLRGEEGVQKFIEENSGYALLIEKAVSWINNRLNCSKCKNNGKRTILELGTGYGLFMNNYLDSIGNDIYISTELKVSKIRDLKKMIEGSGRSPNIIFIATNSTRSPLKKECVDIIVDLISSSYHIKHFKDCPVSKVGKYLKHQGIWIGCNPESDSFSKTKNAKCFVKAINKDYKPDEDCSFLENIQKTDLGSIVSENDLLYGLEENSKIHMKGYMGIKK